VIPHCLLRSIYSIFRFLVPLHTLSLLFLQPRIQALHILLLPRRSCFAATSPARVNKKRARLHLPLRPGLISDIAAAQFTTRQTSFLQPSHSNALDFTLQRVLADHHLAFGVYLLALCILLALLFCATPTTPPSSHLTTYLQRKPEKEKPKKVIC